MTMSYGNLGQENKTNVLNYVHCESVILPNILSSQFSNPVQLRIATTTNDVIPDIYPTYQPTMQNRSLETFMGHIDD